MLQKIEINNFKAIQNGPLTLDNLAPVNYLVGPNGCGKSSVLEGVDAVTKTILQYGINIQDPKQITLNGETIKKHAHKNSVQFQSLQDKSYIKFYINQDYFDIVAIKQLDSKHSDGFINYRYLYVSNYLTSEPETTKFYTAYEGASHLDNPEVSTLAKPSPNQTYSYSQFLLNDVGKFGTSNEINSKIKQFFFECKFFNKKIIRIENTIKNIDDLDSIYNPTRIFFDDETYADLQTQAGGIISLYKLMYSILYRIKIINDRFKEQNQSEKKFIFLLIEEPEFQLHPKFQRILPKMFSEIQIDCPETQFFISTHSPFIVRSALELEGQKVYHLEGGQLKNSFDNKKIREQGVVSFDQVLQDLGFEMKDIYYPNCVIYVEGASDILYIKYWLDLYQKDQDSKFQRGLDYDFVEYGGVLGSHLLANPKMGYSEDDKMINILATNRNFMFIADNDSEEAGGNGSAFEGAKTRIEKEIETLEEATNFTVEFFKFADQDRIPTIESLIDEDKKSRKKVEQAFENVKKWRDNEYTLDSFEKKDKIEKMIRKVYSFVKKANNCP